MPWGACALKPSPNPTTPKTPPSLLRNNCQGGSLCSNSSHMRYHDSVLTYHVENFGCRASQADGAALERQFESRGLAPASAARADVVILNSCTVTNSADQDARAAIRRVRRENPLAKIIVTGCYAQRAPEEIAALPGVTAVIGNSHKHHLAEIILPATPSSVLGKEERALAHEAGTFIPIAAL